ncbi:MAG: clostripain-related cysteine peptidase, partial [Methanosarcinaceae archaeon]|nr:clostripain-related cysteine peptidase [Methanosarcinaceae archaeon]
GGDGGQVSNLLAVYMVGSDLESDNGYASTDIFEILEVAPQNRTAVEIVLAYGGSDLDGWRGMTIADLSDLETDAGDGIIGNEGLYRRAYKSANMGTQKSLDTFLSYLRENYESERYILVFWDHGDAYRGVCFDENHRYDRLELPELSKSLEKSGLHFDLIGFDACLMANLEIAKSISSSADYMLASETIEPTHGWDYVSFVSYLVENPQVSTPKLGQEIIDSYLDNPEHLRPRTLSLLDLSRTETVLDSFDSLVEAMDSRLLIPKSYCGLGASFTKARKFGVEPKENSEISMDLKSFALQVGEEAPELSGKAKTLLEALDSFVVYARYDLGEAGAYGVSLYSPHAGEKAFRGYNPDTLSETWSGFLGNYLERTCADLLDPTISKTGHSFVVEDNSGLAAVRQVYLSTACKGGPAAGGPIFEVLPAEGRAPLPLPEEKGLEGGPSFVLLGNRPAEKNESGYYSLPAWDGKWIYLRDRNTGSYALMSSIYKGKCEEGKLIFFISEVRLLRDGLSRPCLVHLCLDPVNGTVGAYLNPYEFLQNGELLFSREVLKLEEGDVLSTYAVLYGDNSNPQNWVELGKILVGGGTEYVFDYLPPGTYYSALYAEDYHVNFNMTEPEKLVIE